MNSLLTISMITREALSVLKNTCKFTARVNRGYDAKFAEEGAKIGTVVNVRVPPRYMGRTGQALQLENATETSKPVALTTQFGVDLSFSSADLKLSIDDFAKRFIRPAVTTVANKVDYDGLQLYKKVANSVGTAGVTPATNATWLDAGVKLDNLAAPEDPRHIVATPSARGALLFGNQALFNPSAAVSSQYRKGQFSGEMLGFESWNQDQNIARHTVGAWGSSTPLVNLGGQTGSTIAIDGWQSGVSTLNEGDVFTIDGVYAVNPQNRQSTGQLQDFVVTATTTDVTGEMTALPISPSIITSGAFQTVSASPANNAVVTIRGTASTAYPQNLAFHEDAFVLATADLPLPRGVDMASRQSDAETGLSIRLVRAYDINSDQFPCRLDILYGWSPLYTETAVRVWG